MNPAAGDQYWSLLDHGPDGICLCDGQGRVTYANRALERITGQKSDDLVGQTWLDWVLPEHRTWFAGSLSGDRQLQEPENHRSRLMLDGGASVGVDIRICQVDGTGESNFLCVFRERAEDLAWEADLDTFFDFVPDLFTVITPDGFRVKVNPAWERVLGYSQQELLSRPVMDFIHPDDREATQDALERVKDGEELTVFENRYRHADGSYRHFSWTARANPQRRLIFAAARDVTLRKRAEGRVRDSELLYRTISENFPRGAILQIDREFKIVFAAGQLFREMKLDPTEFVGRSVYEVFAKRAIKIIEENYRKTFAGNSTTFEYSSKGRFYVINTFPLTAPSGEVEKILVVEQDLSERKRSEDELKRLNVELIKHNNELRQFAYITSHNLRAPIANIMALVELYQPDGLNDDIINNLRKSATNLDGVISDLNEIVAYRNSKDEIKEEINLHEELQKVQGSITRNILESNAVVRSDFSEVPELFSIKNYVHSFLINLLTNAIKYRSPDRDPVIEVRTRHEGRWYVLEVSDNGLGIDLTKHKGNVFGMYKRFHTHVEGKGLGLHLIKTQAEALRGKVEIKSTVGEGTTFRILLPDR